MARILEFAAKLLPMLPSVFPFFLKQIRSFPEIPTVILLNVIFLVIKYSSKEMHASNLKSRCASSEA